MAHESQSTSGIVKKIADIDVIDLTSEIGVKTATENTKYKNVHNFATLIPLSNGEIRSIEKEKEVCMYGEGVPLEYGDIVLQASPAEIRSKKFPIEVKSKSVIATKTLQTPGISQASCLKIKQNQKKLVSVSSKEATRSKNKTITRVIFNNVPNEEQEQIIHQLVNHLGIPKAVVTPTQKTSSLSSVKNIVTNVTEQKESPSSKMIPLAGKSLIISKRASAENQIFSQDPNIDPVSSVNKKNSSDQQKFVTQGKNISRNLIPTEVVGNTVNKVATVDLTSKMLVNQNPQAVVDTEKSIKANVNMNKHATIPLSRVSNNQKFLTASKTSPRKVKSATPIGQQILNALNPTNKRSNYGAAPNKQNYLNSEAPTILNTPQAFTTSKFGERLAKTNLVKTPLLIEDKDNISTEYSVSNIRIQNVFSTIETMVGQPGEPTLVNFASSTCGKKLEEQSLDDLLRPKPGILQKSKCLDDSATQPEVSGAQKRRRKQTILPKDESVLPEVSGAQRRRRKQTILPKDESVLVVDNPIMAVESEIIDITDDSDERSDLQDKTVKTGNGIIYQEIDGVNVPSGIDKNISEHSTVNPGNFIQNVKKTLNNGDKNLPCILIAVPKNATLLPDKQSQNSGKETDANTVCILPSMPASLAGLHIPKISLSQCQEILNKAKEQNNGSNVVLIATHSNQEETQSGVELNAFSAPVRVDQLSTKTRSIQLPGQKAVGPKSATKSPIVFSPREIDLLPIQSPNALSIPAQKVVNPKPATKKTVVLTPKGNPQSPNAFSTPTLKVVSIKSANKNTIFVKPNQQSPKGELTKTPSSIDPLSSEGASKPVGKIKNILSSKNQTQPVLETLQRNTKGLKSSQLSKKNVSSAKITPVDINQILNRGKEVRCENKPMASRRFFRGFTKEEMRKRVCAKELKAAIQREIKDINKLQQSLTGPLDCFFVQCGAPTTIYLDETEGVEYEPEETEDNEANVTSMLNHVVQNINNEVLKVRKKQNGAKKRLSQTEQALELIKKGLEMIQGISKTSIESSSSPAKKQRRSTKNTVKRSETSYDPIKAKEKRSVQNRKSKITKDFDKIAQVGKRSRRTRSPQKKKIQEDVIDDELMLVKKIKIVGQKGRPKKANL